MANRAPHALLPGGEKVARQRRMRGRHGGSEGLMLGDGASVLVSARESTRFRPLVWTRTETDHSEEVSFGFVLFCEPRSLQHVESLALPPNRGILGFMARQARIEYENVHHVRSRGNNRQAVFLDDPARSVASTENRRSVPNGSADRRLGEVVVGRNDLHRHAADHDVRLLDLIATPRCPFIERSERDPDG